MRNGPYGRTPIFCILPPYVVRNIVENGTEEQRRSALRTLGTDQTFRALRVAQPAPRTPLRRRPSPLMAQV